MNVPSHEQSLARLESLSKLMDGAFAIPGTEIKIGLDGIIGIIPGIGDAIAGIISSYLIWEARKLGAPKWLLARMVANTTVDTMLGAIPVAGDIFDVLFRSNMRNMALLRRHIEKQAMRGRESRAMDNERIRTARMSPL